MDFKIMKYESVKNMKEELEAKWKAEEDYVKSLQERYPDMFSDRWVVLNSSVPVGWQGIVNDLCACINRYVKTTVRTRAKTDARSRFKLFVNKRTRKLLNHIDRLLDPYKPYRPKGQLYWTIAPEIHKKVEKSWRNKLQVKFHSFYMKFFNTYHCYEDYNPPQVYIAQIKQKFGELRFYYDGGDDIVDGMVRYAEYLARNTCEETGKKGSICFNKGWYRVLSPKKAKEHGYTFRKKK